MTNIKNKHISVLEENGKIVGIAKVKVVNEEEYKNLQKRHDEYYAEKSAKESSQTLFILKLDERVEHLENNTIHLAKAIYDNFVDYGFIKDDAKFQKAYYDYVIEGQDIDFNNAPAEFIKILERLVK